MKVTGTFEVKLNPLDVFSAGKNGVSLGRMSINKTFTGDLDAVSKGEMLSAMTSEQGSAAYVAIEQVSGSLSGKQGSFVLQHTGTMNKGEHQLTVVIVPGSGSGELVGLAGKMTINIVEDQHNYELDFELS